MEGRVLGNVTQHVDDDQVERQADGLAPGRVVARIAQADLALVEVLLDPLPEGLDLGPVIVEAELLLGVRLIGVFVAPG